MSTHGAQILSELWRPQMPIGQAMETENFRKALDTYVMEPDYRSGADYRTYATQAVARERELVQALGLARAASRGGA